MNSITLIKSRGDRNTRDTRAMISVTGTDVHVDITCGGFRDQFSFGLEHPDFDLIHFSKTCLDKMVNMELILETFQEDMKKVWTEHLHKMEQECATTKCLSSSQETEKK
jgi:hypothetical protein